MVKYLVKMNEAYYDFSPKSFDAERNSYNPIAVNGADVKSALNSSMLDDLSKIPLEYIQGEIKIISNSNENELLVNGTKSSAELIVAKDDIKIGTHSRIKFFELIHSYGVSGNIKLLLSLDQGASWNTINEGRVQKVNISIPQKDYESMNDMELLLWNNARDFISDNGFTPLDLNTLSGCCLDGREHIRFAYVLEEGSKQDLATTQRLLVNIESDGYLVPVPEDEIEVDVYREHIKIVPATDSDIFKINVMYSVG